MQTSDVSIPARLCFSVPASRHVGISEHAFLLYRPDQLERYGSGESICAPPNVLLSLKISYISSHPPRCIKEQSPDFEARGCFEENQGAPKHERGKETYSSRRFRRGLFEGMMFFNISVLQRPWIEIPRFPPDPESRPFRLPHIFRVKSSRKAQTDRCVHLLPPKASSPSREQTHAKVPAAASTAPPCQRRQPPPPRGISRAHRLPVLWASLRPPVPHQGPLRL